MLRIKKFFIQSLVNILIVLVPVILFCGFMLIENIRLTRDRTEKLQYENFQKGVAQLNHIFSRLETQSIKDYVNLVYILSEQKDNTDENLVNFTRIDTLETYGFDMDVFLYRRGDKYIYTDIGKILYHNFENLSLNLDMSCSQFFTHLNSVTNSALLMLRENYESKKEIAADTQGGSVACIFPFQDDTSIRPFVIVYLLKEPAIRKIIDDYLEGLTGNFYIYDSFLNFIVSSDNHRNTKDVKDRNLFRANSSGILKRNYSGTPSIIMRDTAPFGPFTYMVTIPEAIFYHSINGDIRKLILLVSALTLICFFLAFITSKSNYRPIKAIVREITDRNKIPVKTNEVDFIHSYIKKTRDEGQRAVLESRFVLFFITGRLNDAKKLPFHTLKDKTFWAVVFLGFDEDKTPLPVIEELLKLGKDFPGTGITVFCSELLNEQGICYIINYGAGNEYRNIAETLRERIALAELENFSLGAGCCYSDPSMVKQSFYEAVSAKAMAAGKMKKGIVFFSDVEEGSTATFPLPPDSKFMFIEAIRHDDKQAALSLMNEIFQKANDVSGIALRLLNTVFVNLLVELAAQAGMDLSEKLLAPVLFSPNPDLKAFSNIIDFLCRIYKEKAGDQRKKIHDGVLSFINNHYTSINFSLDYIADSLSFSKSKISAIIKEKFDCGFAQYISLLRMNEVKRRLLESEDTVQDIIREVGYSGISNFEHKFRQAEGLTPLQFRLAYRATKKDRG